MSAIGLSNLSILRCNSEASNEWIRLGAVAARWRLISTLLVSSVATDETNEVDINRHRAATAPNLIHSLDASLLHLSINKFDKPIALIHDSVLTQSVDMDELSAIIRETYMHLFAEHDYLNDFAQQIGAETEPPIIGDLKPESVINSTYFFC